MSRSPGKRSRFTAAGQRQEFEVKTLGPIYTQMDKGQQPLRLVVVKPVRYHLTKTQTDRRQPAFPICN